MSTIDDAKKSVRQEIKLLKKMMPDEERFSKSKRIFAQIEALSQFKNAEIVMLYWSMDDEVFTHDITQKWALTKKVILPCVCGDKLILKQFTGIENMKLGENFQIPEPDDADFFDIDKIEIIIVPGVAFDKENNRMGRGKAFYDKLLSSVKALKIGVCFDFQLKEKIPVDDYDIKMD